MTVGDRIWRPIPAIPAETEQLLAATGQPQWVLEGERMNANANGPRWVSEPKEPTARALARLEADWRREHRVDEALRRAARVSVRRDVSVLLLTLWWMRERAQMWRALT